jgi:uncharacterized protein YbjT (DUF2867 family)
MKKRTIAVIGATGSQGKGVVEALIKDDSFEVRGVTRNPDNYSGNAHKVVKADLSDLNSLTEAFRNTHGVFVVTNFWEGADEIAQGKIAIQAAKDAGVNHFIWSTLPDVEKISNNVFDVPHFTHKAQVDELVREAGFENYTFVQPPFYFQNFIGMMGPQPKEDGSTGWTLPLDPTKKVIHMSDINDLGKVVTGAFLNPEKVGNGSYLSLATELNSFEDILDTYKSNGNDYSFTQVPGEVFSTFFEGAGEIAQMLAYFETHTYMGPNADNQIKSAKEIATENLTSLNDWIKQNN